MRSDSLRNGIFLLILAFVVGGGAVAARAQTVFLVCTWDTSSIFKGKDGREMFERRFYVSPVVEMNKDEFFGIDRDGDRIEGLCSTYLEKTVISAAADRGERLDTGGTLKVLRNVELSGENLDSTNTYQFSTKEQIEKRKEDAIKEMRSADRVVLSFNWDVTGEKESGDLENEKKRTVPTVVPKADPKPAKPH